MVHHIAPLVIALFLVSIVGLVCYAGLKKRREPGLPSRVIRPACFGLLLWSLVASAGPANVPDAQALLRYTQHLREPAKGPEFVMPVGSGDLSAVVSFDSALQLHFSKSDWLGHPVLAPTGSAAPGAPVAAPGGQRVAPMSPGHLSLTLGGLTSADIRSFDQYMDFGRGQVVIKIGTDNGSLELAVFGEMTRKALVIEVHDGRTNRGNARAHFSQWRPAMRIATAGNVVTGEEIHQVTPPYRNGGDIALTKLGLGVAVSATGGQIKDGAVEIPADHAGDFRVMVTAQVTRDGHPLASALAKLRELQAVAPAVIRSQHDAWWKDFWNRSWLEMSGDKDAEYLTRLWLTDLYTFAGIFGGRLPPTFNGSSMLVMNDYSSWTGIYTWQNTRELIWPMGSANHCEYASLYFKTLDRYFNWCQDHAAKNGKTGLWLWENVEHWQDPDNQFDPKPDRRTATPFDRKKLEDRSNLDLERSGGSWYHHTTQDGAELVQLMFDHVRYTGDEKFLKEVCAPWLRECTLFYLKYLKQDADGLWHMMPANAAETWWKVKDSMTEMCGARYCLEQVSKHGQEFAYEPELIAMARDRLERLAPLPVGRWRQKICKNDEIEILRQKYPKAGGLGKNVREVTVFDGVEKTDEVYSIAADIGEDPIRHNAENPDLYIVFPYTRVGIGSEASDLLRGIKTFTERAFRNSYGWSPDGVQAARLGLPDTADVILHHASRQQTYPYGGWRNCAGDLPGSTTKGVTDTPQLDTAGVNMTAIQEMLLQSHDLATGEKLLDGGPIRLLPATRKEWSGRFKLRARGGFLVTCEFENGTVKRATIQSERGRQLQVVNPFASCAITVNGKPQPASKERLIVLPTQPGGTIVLSAQ